ncbi:MAG: alcohol dehydrogenase catalytic domain-containing protein [Armatimonadota bacterium]
MWKDLEEYMSGHQQIPDKKLAWFLYGVGLENLGDETNSPEPTEVTPPGPRHLLTRVDAAGLCFSDTKIIKQGGSHPRLYGRDLSEDPVIPGHEAALTVIAVGEEMKDDYAIGDRFVVQADIYYKGKNLAFGYMLPGALEQYVMLTEEILFGDDGVYLVPVQPDTGYAEAALAEPWACVVRAYRDVRRSSLKAGGTAWVIGTPGCQEHSYNLGAFEFGPIPRRVVMTDLPDTLASAIRNIAVPGGVQVVETDPLSELDLETMAEEYGAEGLFDDIFILGDKSADAVEAADPYINKGGRMTLVAEKAPQRPVSIDIGRIHYDGTYYAAAPPSNPLQGYRKNRDIDLIAGGKTWIVGGGGPMGQMHVQWAIESVDSPAVVVVSDIDTERLETTKTKFQDAADGNGVELILLNPTEMTPEEYDERLWEIAPDGFDDIVMMAAVPKLVASSALYLGENSMFNMFAGVGRGTTVPIDFTPVVESGARFYGSSGSAIEDLAQTLSMAEKGELSPNRAIAGVGGMDAAWDGMEAVRDGTFAGKIVIYPQVEHFPLTRLEDLDESLPDVAAKLGPAGQWTREAEQAFIAHFLQES